MAFMSMFLLLIFGELVLVSLSWVIISFVIIVTTKLIKSLLVEEISVRVVKAFVVRQDVEAHLIIKATIHLLQGLRMASSFLILLVLLLWFIFLRLGFLLFVLFIILDLAASELYLLSSSLLLIIFPAGLLLELSLAFVCHWLFRDIFLRFLFFHLYII